MPEMPEVQAHAERMTEALKGRALMKFELLNFAALKTFDPPADGAVGHKLISVDRRAKYLLLTFDNGHTHVVHLMQGGRLRPDPKRSRKPKLGLARWVFGGPDSDTDGGNAGGAADGGDADGGAAGADNTGGAAGAGGSDGGSDSQEAWMLTEAGTERKAGVWAVDGDPLPQDPLLGLGPEADTVSRDELASILGANSKRLHGLLRNQKVLAGLGRMLTNEIIYEARISPFANASKLTDEQIDTLHAAIGEVVARATDHERTLDDIGKSIDRPSKVHNRSGEPCVDCDDTIRTVEYRRYTVYYCPTHQTNGKLLADNTTSKFLK